MELWKIVEEKRWVKRERRKLIVGMELDELWKNS